jgi:hypothetical protein
MACAAVVVACGGGGASSDAEAIPGSTSSTTVPDLVPHVESALPNVPSAYVRYEGEFTTLNEQGKRVPFWRNLFDVQLARCNGIRGAPEYREAQAPAIGELIWYAADHNAMTIMYDSKTGASRIEKRHAYPTLEIYFADGIAQCDRFRMNYSYSTGIDSSDGNSYGVEYDFDTGLIKRVVGHPTGPRATLPLAWSDAWPIRTIVEEHCAQVPSAGDGTFGASECRWTAYARTRFGPLPIFLDSLVKAAGYEHRWVAKSANHVRLDSGPGAELLSVDRLPDGVPVEMRSDPAPVDPDDDKPSEDRAVRRASLLP